MIGCVIHTLCYILKKKTGDIITFSQFEEENLSSENNDDTESSNKSDEHSSLRPIISEEEMDVISSGNESDAEPMSTEMLEDICDGSQYHPIVNSRDACYKISDFIK